MPVKSIPRAMNREIWCRAFVSGFFFCFWVFNFSPVGIDENSEPIWFKWLKAVEVEFFLDEVKDILEGVVGVRESKFFKGALYLSF